jgi:hypothetical protein
MVAAQGVELRPEVRIERGLEASGRAGIGRAVNETWNAGLKKHGQDLKQEIKRQLPPIQAQQI